MVRSYGRLGGESAAHLSLDIAFLPPPHPFLKLFIVPVAYCPARPPALWKINA